jgi:hypothetical protein
MRVCRRVLIALLLALPIAAQAQTLNSYTASGSSSWTKPAQCNAVLVVVYGSGGQGGGGQGKAAVNTRQGGTAGGGGAGVRHL